MEVFRYGKEIVTEVGRCNMRVAQGRWVEGVLYKKMRVTRGADGADDSAVVMSKLYAVPVGLWATSEKVGVVNTIGELGYASNPTR